MTIDVLVLNTLAVDYRLRGDEGSWIEGLVGEGGLAKCAREALPKHCDEQQSQEWIKQGKTTAGGPGNCAPLIARAGLKVAVVGNLGSGNFDGLDATGRFFYDTMAKNNVDMSNIFIHPTLPSGRSFIHEISKDERGGIAYFPLANDDFDFNRCKVALARLKPKIVHYMYSGLSERADRNGGRDLADFIQWGVEQDIITLVDTHTHTGKPKEAIKSGKALWQYSLLEPVLKAVDLFFCSYAEARMIANTLPALRDKGINRLTTEIEFCYQFLEWLQRYHLQSSRSRLFGVTVKDGAYFRVGKPGISIKREKVKTNFMTREKINLVGAGDAFRAGLLAYTTQHMDEFRRGTMDYRKAIQMGNLFAALYIKAPLHDRYSLIADYEQMLRVVRDEKTYTTLSDLKAALGK